jgi:hypothetical protein
MVGPAKEAAYRSPADADSSAREQRPHTAASAPGFSGRFSSVVAAGTSDG